MELWHGPIKDFVHGAQSRLLPREMIAAFSRYHGYRVPESEVTSWENSLDALATTAGDLRARDVGVVVEYHLPFSGQRIDVVFLGRSQKGKPRALVVELKQWAEVAIEDEYALNVLVGGKEHQHPSQQAWDYAGALHDIHSSFVEERLYAAPCSYCHNLTTERAAALLGKQFTDLLKVSPLFKKDDEVLLREHLSTQVGRGDGLALMSEYVSGRFLPNKKLLDVLEATLQHEEEWHLLGRQREAYNAILSKVLRLRKKHERAVVLIRGGPGTGKTVIAVQLLAEALRKKLVAAHSTGGKAFTTALRSKFKGAGRLFIWNMNTRDALPGAFDLLLVDEAHRVRKTSNTRYSKRSDRSQMEELLGSSKVTVFLLDENQYVRPDEIGSTELIRSTTRNLGLPLQEYDLDTQFRCGGCVEYATWVDYLLGYAPQKPAPWGRQYRLTIVKTPAGLDAMMAEAVGKGERSRIVAGFCWPWSDPRPDGTLPPDVQVGDWCRPWNAKRDPKKSYNPSNDPYTLWAETEVGERQIGCIYSIQGFEFDRVGVIWGKDLVWRDGEWVAQRRHSHDKPVKAKTADTLRLVRNAYRVLLTRGIRQTYLLCLDGETRAHIAQELEGMQSSEVVAGGQGEADE